MEFMTKTTAEQLIELGNELLEETNMKLKSLNVKDYKQSFSYRHIKDSMIVDLFDEWSAQVYSFIKKNHKDDELGIYLIEAYVGLTKGNNRRWYDKAMQFLKTVK